MTTTDRGRLMAVTPEGSTRWVPNSYEGIKSGLADATLAFLVVTADVGYYLDDEGMLNGAPLNVTASWFAGRPIYGPVVLCAAQPDDEGDTLPAPEHATRAAAQWAANWASVVAEAAALGQDLTVRANADTIPPPVIMALPDDWEPGDPWPTPV